MNAIIDRKMYNTETATKLADDHYWDGSNFERRGRNQYLYRSPKGAYFTVTTTQWQGERDTLTPISLDDAIELYEGALSEHHVPYAEAFPGVEVQGA